MMGEARYVPSRWELGAVLGVALAAAPLAGLVSIGIGTPLAAFVAGSLVANGAFLMAFLGWMSEPARRAHVATLRPVWDDVLRSLVLMLGAVVAAVAVLAAASLLGVTPSGEGVHVLPDSRAAVVAIAATRYVIGPVAEELFFRGVLLGGLAARIGGGAAVVVQSLVFGLAHLRSLSPPDVGTAISATAVGLVLGLGVLRYRRLLPAVVAHALVNLL